MNPEYLTHRRIRVPDASPEPLTQLLNQAQRSLDESPGLDTVRWLHDGLAFLTEFFTAFALGALKTVGPYSTPLEQLLKTAPSLDRSERLLGQAFIDWRAHPHHPAYESLKDAFYLTSRLQSSRTAPRRHTRWLGIEGRSVEGLEQLSRWSRRLDLLVNVDDEAAAKEQVRLYLPLLWIWTDALESFFRDWSLQLSSEVLDGKLKIGGSANRDDIHLQLFPSPTVLGLKGRFASDVGGGLRLDGFSPSTNGVTVALSPSEPVPDVEVQEPVAAVVVDEPAVPEPVAAVVIDEPVVPEPVAAVVVDEPMVPEPVAAVVVDEPVVPQPVGDADISLVYDDQSGTYIINGGAAVIAASAPHPSDLEFELPLPPAEVPIPTPSLLDPMLPDLGLPTPEESGETALPFSIPEFAPAPELQPEVEMTIEAPLVESVALPAVIETLAAPEPERTPLEPDLFADEPVSMEIPGPGDLPDLELDPIEFSSSSQESSIEETVEVDFFATGASQETDSPADADLFSSDQESVDAAPFDSREPDLFTDEESAEEPDLFSVDLGPVDFTMDTSDSDPFGSSAPLFAPADSVGAVVGDFPGVEESVEAVPDEPESPAGLPDFSAPPVESVEAVPDEPESPAGLPDFSALPVEPVEAAPDEPESPAGLPDFSAPPVESTPTTAFVPPLPVLPEPDLDFDVSSTEPPPSFVPPVLETPLAVAQEPAVGPDSIEAIVAPSEMGSRAEEILEDDFHFSPAAGPARPQWKGWGVSERESVQQVCAQSVSVNDGKIATAFAEPILQALKSDAPKFQVVLAAGSGKSHLARDIQALGAVGSFGPAVLADWPPNSAEPADEKELVSFYFRLREDVKAQGAQVVLPEPETVASLAAIVPRDGFGSAFQRLLGQIAVLNPKGLTLLLDEPPEGVRLCLALALPKKLRVVTFVTPLNSDPALGSRVDLQTVWQKAALEIFGPAVMQIASDPAANLLRVGLYTQLLATGASHQGALADIGSAAFQSSRADLDLLACLALERHPVSLDDLDQWYLKSGSVSECVQSFPVLFQMRSTRLSPLLGLSHHSIEGAVREQLEDRYRRAANRLLGWVITQLERTSSEKYGGLQVRDIVFRNFCRLYRYAQLTESQEALEWVARNKDLQRNRVALTTFLEKPASRWELQKLLSLLVETLAKLTEHGQCADLRDELAWSLSNLGLNELHLGLANQAHRNVTSALDLFMQLVEKEKQHEFRPALATTLYRASKIADALGESQEAHDFADRSVSELIELVEDRGRMDLQSRLGIALAHRGGLKRASDDIAGALKDLQRASALLASSSEEKLRDNKRSQIEVQLELSSIYLKANDIDSAVKESGKAVQLATQAVEELQLDDLQPLLASCHTARGHCYLELHETDRAQRDVSKSITLRNLAIDEGRLDQRYDLAKDHLLRARIDLGRSLFDDAARDLGRAVEIFEQLVSEGRADAKKKLLRALVQRSDLALSRGQSARGIEDLKQAFEVAQGDTSTAPDAIKARLMVLDGLLRAYQRSGDSEQALAVSGELLAAYQASQDWESYARVQVIRGTAFEQQANFVGANECFTQAVSLLSKLLEQGQTDELLDLVAQAYLGSGQVELHLGNADRASDHTKRALDIYNHLFQQRAMKTALPKMLQAYSLFASVALTKGRNSDALTSLKSGFDILSYLENQGGVGGLDGIELRKAQLYRQRARALFQQGDPGQALQDSEEAMRNFLLDRQKNQTGPWKDELARTWRLRSSIFFLLKDFAQAESSIQESINHFEELVRAGKSQYFEDLMSSLSTRAENAGKAGKIDRVLEEYGRMLTFASAAAQTGSNINSELESAKILEKRARVYRDQGLFNEAYGDYDRVIGSYRKLLTDKGSNELALELVRVYLERGEMIANAGHAEHALGDFTEAINVAKALVGQGVLDAASSLARGLQRRADCYRALGKAREALADLEGAVGFQMQMAQQRQDADLMGSLARALLSQGTLLVGFQQIPQAATALDNAIQILTGLVEQQHQKQYSGDMAQALIQRVSLSGDKTDPALRQVLIRAVELVTQQAREGQPVTRDFPMDCLRAVVDLLSREDFDTVGDLIDAVLKLVELVVADGKSNQDFVKLTDLLLAASAGLIDDRRTARRPHFLALACVSCNREIQMFGKNSLPRLVYCLYELGQALERSKAPAVLNYIGSSFALLGELASQQQNNEEFLRELKMMVTTWRSLPPQVPALANVSRHMLSQLLRLT